MGLLELFWKLLRALGFGKSDTTTMPGEAPVPTTAQTTTANYHLYRLRDDFLSPAELNFYRVLVQSVSTQGTVLTKVSLGDLFFVNSRDASEQRSYQNRIDRKHVDFVICNPTTLTPCVGIELDDRSHSRPDRQTRDEFVEGVFDAAGLPLVRFPVQRSYQPQELAARVLPYLGHAPATPSPALSTPTEQQSDLAHGHAHITEASLQEPHCPKCGTPMVLRTVKNGNNAGQQFWGCSNYPRCRTMLPYQPEAMTSTLA